MSDVVIRAEGLGKKYLIGHQAQGERYTALRDVLARTAKGLARSVRDMMSGRQLITGDEVEEFWALKDVNFEIRRGELVGIIGRNGAGKSTLLKILSRISEPSTGHVEIRGQVASLLEVGTGFHPELTGRENIYLNGAILGMSRAEIKRKFDEIVAFAEVERFLDTPVKHYSSGMYVRLAFAVAAHLEPEILVVDEVLAVGDAAFQKKCLGKIGEVAGHGRTVLFVSHNMSAVQSLCSKAFCLDKGLINQSGTVSDVVAAYTQTADAIIEYFREPIPSSFVYLVGGKARYVPFLRDISASIIIELTIFASKSTIVAIEIRIGDIYGAPLAFATIGGFNPGEMISLTPQLNRIKIQLNAFGLAKGRYSISVDITNPNISYYDRVNYCLEVDVEPVLLDGSVRCLDQKYGFGSFHLPASLLD